MSLTVSLIAVLIPLLFMGDIVGRLFREFAVTLSVTILISAAVSLTLTPMMCAKLLRHRPDAEQGRFYKASEHAFTRVVDFYSRTLTWVLAHQTTTLVVAVATLASTILLYIVIPKGFFPVQDTGVIMGVSEAPQTVSFAAMAERQRGLARVILEDPAVERLTSFIGIDATNTTLNLSSRLHRALIRNDFSGDRVDIERERLIASPPQLDVMAAGRHRQRFVVGPEVRDAADVDAVDVDVRVARRDLEAHARGVGRARLHGDAA